MMNAKLFPNLCFTILTTFLIKNSYTSDFHVISTTEKPAQNNKKDDGLKLCFILVQTKLQEIENLLKHIRNDNKKQLVEIKDNMLTKIEHIRNDNKKQLEEIEVKMLNKIQEQLQEGRLKNEKQFRELENKIMNETLEKKLGDNQQQLENNDNKNEKQLFKIEEEQQKVQEKLQKLETKIGEDSLFQEKQLQKIKSLILTHVEEKGNKTRTKIDTEKAETGQRLEKFFQNITVKLEETSNKIQDELINALDKLKETTLPSSCQNILGIDNVSSGIYTIKPKSFRKSFEVLCDFSTRGGGWTYIMNRFDGSQDFFLNWTDYKNGFGSSSGEFWIGLEHLYEITNSHSKNELLVELVDWKGVKKYALYDDFKVGGENELYKIKFLGKYSGNAGDSLRYHENHNFSTKDKDSTNYCVNKYKGAWWFTGCFDCHLNGPYRKQNFEATGMTWNSFHVDYSLKEARMMIKPKNL